MPGGYHGLQDGSYAEYYQIARLAFISFSVIATFSD